MSTTFKQNILLNVTSVNILFWTLCKIAFSATTAGDSELEEELIHLKIRKQAENVKAELDGVAGNFTQLL